jgi:site-specific DNA-methyltransferase (adenine-specific)
MSHQNYPNALASHNTTEWSTPQDFFDKLNEKYHFTLDVAASEENHKCDRYYTKEENGLAQPWEGVIWCNPPYGKDELNWVIKAISCKNKVVMLLPVKTSTDCWHDFIVPFGKVTFIRDKLKFGGYSHKAMFDSMLVEFN